ncbi:hypothetical protein ACGFYP_33620 [Streptomyces sp. NPDC048370]|uniref:hypothetical protein n=1 Tax=Streptomyces sp. NPDC048370 TaxID=3365540 RepID=UPI003715E9C7
MEEVALQLEELLFPSIADVAVLSVDVDIALVRVDARCTRTAPSARGAGSGRTGSMAPTCGFPLMWRAPGEALFSG